MRRGFGSRFGVVVYKEMIKSHLAIVAGVAAKCERGYALLELGPVRAKMVITGSPGQSGAPDQNSIGCGQAVDKTASFAYPVLGNQEVCVHELRVKRGTLCKCCSKIVFRARLITEPQSDLGGGRIRPVGNIGRKCFILTQELLKLLERGLRAALEACEIGRAHQPDLSTPGKSDLGTASTGLGIVALDQCDRRAHQPRRGHAGMLCEQVFKCRNGAGKIVFRLLQVRPSQGDPWCGICRTNRALVGGECRLRVTQQPGIPCQSMQIKIPIDKIRSHIGVGRLIGKFGSQLRQFTVHVAFSVRKLQKHVMMFASVAMIVSGMVTMVASVVMIVAGMVVMAATVVMIAARVVSPGHDIMRDCHGQQNKERRHGE